MPQILPIRPQPSRMFGRPLARWIGSGAVSNIPINNYVGLIGASSVAAGGDLENLAQLVSSDDVAGVQFWAIMLSDGQLCWGGASALGGSNVQTIYETYWPLMRDATPKRGFVGFFGGTNDIDAIAPSGTPSPSNIADRIAYVRAFIDEARANGQVPFVVAPQPNEVTGQYGTVAMPAWRTALEDLCTEKNAIFADVFSALGDPETGLWLSDTYVKGGDPTADAHISAIGGPLAGQVISDALTPYRKSSHNPVLVATGAATTGFAWLGGLFPDGDADNSPDGGGTSLVTDAWGAPSGTASRVVTAGTGDIDGNWFGINMTGAPTTSATSLTPATAPGAVPTTEDNTFEIAYHVNTAMASATAGYGLKLGVGSTYLLYHRGIRASAAISDKIIWALHTAPAGIPLSRWTFGVEVTGTNADTGQVDIAELSLREIQGVRVATGTMTWYGKAIQALVNGDLDLNAGTFKVALASSSYSPNVDTHDFWDDVSANEVTGTGWSAGGVTVTVTTDIDTTNNRVRVFVSDVSQPTVTLTDGKYIVLYKDTGTPGTSNLIGYAAADTALAPVAGTLAIDFDGTNGALRIGY